MLAVIFSYQQRRRHHRANLRAVGVRPTSTCCTRSPGGSCTCPRSATATAPKSKGPQPAFRRFAGGAPAADAGDRGLRAGGFPELIVAEKQACMAALVCPDRTGQQADESMQAEMRPRLRQFTEELAEYHHAAAQALVSAKEPDDAQADGPVGAEARAHYAAASDYYQLFIDSFPDDPALAEMGFSWPPAVSRPVTIGRRSPATSGSPTTFLNTASGPKRLPRDTCHQHLPAAEAVERAA